MFIKGVVNCDLCDEKKVLGFHFFARGATGRVCNVLDVCHECDGNSHGKARVIPLPKFRHGQSLFPMDIWTTKEEVVVSKKTDWLELKPAEGPEFKVEDFTCILVKPLPELDSEKAEYFREFWEELRK